jgi:hypothetical protein
MYREGMYVVCASDSVLMDSISSMPSLRKLKWSLMVCHSILMDSSKFCYAS